MNTRPGKFSGLISGCRCFGFGLGPDRSEAAAIRHLNANAVAEDDCPGDVIQRQNATTPNRATVPLVTHGDAPYMELNMDPNQGELEIVQYEPPECKALFTLDPSNETVWATQQQIAEAFGVRVPAISKHIANIYAEGELTPEATLSKMENVRTVGEALRQAFERSL